MLTKEQFEYIEKYRTTDSKDTPCVVYLGGKRFEGTAGKRVWANKRNASLAISHGVRGIVERFVMDDLRKNHGYTSSQAYASKEYKQAWDKFLAWANETGYIKIVELHEN